MAKRPPRGTSPWLINERLLSVYPTLAAKIGLNEAIIVQQIHYWLDRSDHVFDGKLWIYNTYDEWHAQFPFWSAITIKRTILALEAAGLVESTSRFNRNPIDKSKWYTLNYQLLNELCTSSTDHIDTSTDHIDTSTDHPDTRTDHIDPLDGSNGYDDVSNRSHSQRVLPENYAETSPPQTPPPAGEGPSAIAGGEEESAVAGGEEENALATFAPVLRRMPWDKPIPPAIAACPLCDTHGFVEVVDAQGTLFMLTCPHDTVRLRAAAAQQGYQLVREDRSREPPAAPQEGGPGG
jgi:hypothetical protein